MKNNIVIRIEEKSEYREVEKLVKSCLIIHWRKQQSLAVEHYALKEILIFTVRVDSSRQASMVSVIMDCRREKMHRSFCVKNLYLVILTGLLGSIPHRKAIL